MDGIVLKIFSELIDDLLKEGNLLSQVNHYNKAIEFYSRAVQSNPRDTKALFERGKILLTSGEYKGALADFNLLIYIDDNDFFYFWRGLTELLLQRYKSARDDFTTTLTSDIIYNYHFDIIPLAYLLRGVTNYMLNTLDEALKDYDLAIKKFPDFPEAYLFRGFIYWDKNMKDKALSDWRQSILLGNDSAIDLVFHFSNFT